jgi:hydrogenase 3 maturation protease
LTKKQHNIEKDLKDWFSKADRVAIAGIGNPIRFDDFVGMKIVQDLQGKIPENVFLLECETVPESFMDEIIELRPSHVLLIDAAIMGLKPAEVRLFDAEKVTNFPAISTHMLPLRMLCEYITQLAGAKIALLLVEPKNVEFGEGLTPEVALSAKRIVKILLSIFS